MPSFGWEVKPSAKCREILLCYSSLRSMTDITSDNFKGIFRNQRGLMNQEGLELRWGRTIDQKMATVHWTLCTIPLSNNN
jgi:hypothetical protein